MEWPNSENFVLAFMLVGFSIYGLAYAPVAFVVFAVLMAVVIPLFGYPGSSHKRQR